MYIGMYSNMFISFFVCLLFAASVPVSKSTVEINAKKNGKLDWWMNLMVNYDFPEIVVDKMTHDPLGHFQIPMTEFTEMKGTSGLRCSCCDHDKKNKKQTRYMCIQCSYRSKPFPKFFPVCQVRLNDKSCWEKHIQECEENEE
jgi:hypothetical protein